MIGRTVLSLAGGPPDLRERVVAGEGRAKIAVIDIARPISARPETGALGLRPRRSVVERVAAELELARHDELVRAVVLRIDSPGGSVTASDTLYEEVRRFRETRRVPVVAQLMDIATSGAYYVALAADEIVASPTTVTGSVGVVLYSVSLAGLMDKLGIRDQTVKTGGMKDLGTPLREMTAEEREVLQGLLEEMQQRFLALVRRNRPGLPEEAVNEIADGRVMGARRALELGLVNRVASLPQTLESLRERIGDRDARIVLYRRPDEFADTPLASAGGAAAAGAAAPPLAHFLGSPRPLYLWVP